MKKGIKIVVIGGGASYTPELAEGLIKRYNELPTRELWLVDIEAGKEKLEIIGTMTKRMMEVAGLDCEIYFTLDRRKALKDADFVIAQFRVGLLDARVKDEQILLSHGIIGQETSGLGGMFAALRTIPIILDIVEDMQELCLNAWLINLTNPVGMVTKAASKYAKWEKAIGVCNEPIYSNAVCEIINSIYNNNGALGEVSYDYLVEMSSYINASTADPVNLEKFPPDQHDLLQVVKTMEELIIEAAVTGDYDTALQAFTLNPLLNSEDAAKKLLDEMLEAHEKLLPQFSLQRKGQFYRKLLNLFDEK